MNTNKSQLRELAEGVRHWGKSLTDVWPAEPDFTDAYQAGAIDEDGNRYPVIDVDAWQYDAPGDSEKLARFFTAATPAAVLALLDEVEALQGSDALPSLQEAITQLDRWQSLVEPLQTHMEALQDLTGGVEGPLFDAINDLLIEHTKRVASALAAPFDLLEDWWLAHRFGTEPMIVRIDGQQRIINTHRRLAWLILRCGVNE